MSTEAFQGLLDDFLLESQERVTRVEELLLQASDAAAGDREALLDEARRELHTLKGNAGMMGLEELQSVAHALEDSLADLGNADDFQPLLALLDTYKASMDGLKGATAETQAQAERRPDAGVEATSRTPGSVRVPFTTLDDLVDLLAEMVIFRNRLEDAVGRGASAAEDRQPWEEVEEAHEALGKTLSFIQDRVMGLRMVPLKTLFGSLRRIVHDESRRTGRLARLDTVGGDTPMDKALLEVASEALGHLVRNAITHGLELPRDRQLAGKPTEGTVRLTALVNANEVWIDVLDDGQGIDRAKLLRTAEERGIAVGTGADVLEVLFEPGFSTREVADVAAGRGIGLSAA
ncbi:MAG: Hpt domain-containing protein, partial [Thermoanaerobaculia bacterium]